MEDSSAPQRSVDGGFQRCGQSVQSESIIQRCDNFLVGTTGFSFSRSISLTRRIFTIDPLY
jgi:hypothetical protein